MQWWPSDKIYARTTPSPEETPLGIHLVKAHFASCWPLSFVLATLFQYHMLLVAYDQHHD